MLHSEGREDTAADTEVGRTQLGIFLRSIEAQRHISKVFRIHQITPWLQPSSLVDTRGFQLRTLTHGVEVDAEHPHPIVGEREGKLPDLRTGYFTVLTFVRKRWFD
jgi:hypothetical protein